ALVFAGTPYAWTPIGSAQYIDQATIEEFRAFYEKWYVPNNATLSIAGDIDIEETKRLGEAYFGPIPRGAESERPDIEFDLDAPAEELEVVESFTPLPATMHVWRAPPKTHPDANAIDLMIKILADGKSSRLYRRLVDLEGVAVSSSAYTWLQEKAGLVAVYAIGNQGVGLDVLDTLVSEEVSKLVSEGVAERELQKAKNMAESEIASSYGAMRDRARSLANYHLWYGDAGYINTELDRYL